MPECLRKHSGIRMFFQTPLHILVGDAPLEFRNLSREKRDKTFGRIASIVKQQLSLPKVLRSHVYLRFTQSMETAVSSPPKPRLSANGTPINVRGMILL